MRVRARQGLDAQLARVGVRSSGVRKELAPSSGPIYAEIVRYAETGGFDLVVVGSHGASGLERMLLGSVADKVVRYSHAAVLVARAGEPGARGDVLVGSDLSDGARVALLAGAREAARRKRRLTVVHALGIPAEVLPLGYAPIVPPPPPSPDLAIAQRQAMKERLERLLRDNQIEASVVIEEGDPAAVITALAETMAADLIVVGASGKTGLARVLLGSVATAVVHKAPCSTLITRPEA
jgi:nucleotide-binding universal stress UspA family protein